MGDFDMFRLQFGLPIAIAVLVVGCDASDKDAQRQPPPVEETVFADTLAAKERARKDVEKAMQQSKEKTEQAIKQGEAAE